MSDGLDDIRDTIRDRVKELGLKPAAVSRMATGKPDMYRKFVEEGTAPRADRLRLLCRAIGLEFYIGPPRTGMVDHQSIVLATGKAVETTEAKTEPKISAQASRSAGENSTEIDAVAAWVGATNAQRAQAVRRLHAVALSNELTAVGFLRAEADATAASEAGVSVGAVAGWRRRVRDSPPSARLAVLLDDPRSGRPPKEWVGLGAKELWQEWCASMLCEVPPEPYVVYRRLKGIALEKGWKIPSYKLFVRRSKREHGEHTHGDDLLLPKKPPTKTVNLDVDDDLPQPLPQPVRKIV